MIDLSNVNTWCNFYGLMSIELLPGHTDDCNSFVMLNGGYGNFCLNVKAEERKNNEAYNSLSWSSSTEAFVVVDTGTVYLYDWKKSNPETILRQQVEENFNDFYRYIKKNSYKSSNDIVPFIIDIFRSFRNLLTSDKNSLQALNLLFALLIGIEENENDFKKWGLEDENIEIPSCFDLYLEKLRNGFQNRKPYLNVILKHSAGVLFQEAQKEVLYFDRQLDLYGLSSNLISVKRNRYSSFHYTPSYLARSIVENVLKYLDLDKDNLKILDPACGSSEFLVEILKQLYNRRYRGFVRIIGWDSSEIAIKISRFRLLYEKRTLWNEKLNFKIEYSDDSLGEIWDNDYDLILMNPPFVSWDKMDDYSKGLVRQVFAENKGVTKPNQASAFFYKSIQSLNSIGVIGCVIPSSFLNLDSYSDLRNQIMELINIKFLAKLGNFIFEDALTDVSLIIGCKHDDQDKINSPYILWTRNEKNIAQSALRDLRKMQFEKSPKCIKKEYSIYQPDKFPIASESWNLISFQEYNLLENINKFILQNRLVIVKEIFNVRQGIRTGDKVFKISNQQYLELSKEERKFFRPVIENKSIKNGSIIADNHSYVWYPYDQKGLMINSETQLEEKAPIFFQKLLLSKDVLTRKSRRESCWWKLSEHRAWLRKNEPRLISTEFGKSDSFAFDEKGIFAIERGNAWLPKKKFDGLDYYFYLSIFSSPFFDTLLSIYSKQLLSGWDLGNAHTKNIPIPNVHSLGIRDSSPYIKLVEMGKELSQGNFHLRVMLDEILLNFFYPND